MIVLGVVFLIFSLFVTNIYQKIDRDKLQSEVDGLYASLIGQEHRLGIKLELLSVENERLRGIKNE